MGKSKFSLANQVAIVSGGGTGIGRAIALEFAGAGADVVIAGRRLDVLEKAAEEIRALSVALTAKSSIIEIRLQC